MTSFKESRDRASRRRNRFSRVEALESKLLLAADVSVYETQHMLVIVSDDAGAQFEVLGDADGNVTVAAIGADTTVNGEATPIVVPAGFEDLIVRLRADDQFLEMEGVDVPDDLVMSFNGNRGEVTLTDVRVTDNTRLQAQDGGVDLDILDSVFGRNLYMGGVGTPIASEPRADDISVTRSSVGGNLYAYTGNGHDELRLQGVTVAGRGRIDTGVGDDHVCVIDSAFDALEARMNRGEDRFDATGSTARIATIEGGSGFDVVGDDGTNVVHTLRGTGFEETTEEVCEDDVQLPTFELYINPSDPLLLSVEGEDGTKIEYFGSKDASGLATSLETIFYTDANGDESVIEVDENGRPTRILTPIGDVLTFDWLSETEVVAGLVSADGELQVSTVVDVSGSGSPQPIAVPTLAVQGAPRGGLSIEAIAAPTAISATPALLTATSGSVVTVKKCDDEPVENATVKMIVQPDSGVSFVVPATYIGAGNYEAAIPTKDVNAGETAESICESVLDVLSLCFLVEPIPPAGITQICLGLAAAVDLALGGPTGEGAAIFAACNAGLLGYQAACKANPSPAPGAPGLLDVLCANIGDIVDRAIGEDYLLTPIVSVPGQGNFTAPAQSALVSGPFPSFNVETGDEVEIASFTVSPADPGPGQSYVATVNIECAPPNSTVTISVVGTDGFTSSTTCQISSDGVCTLNVPGGAAGVSDVVTVSVAGGPTRTVGLVF